VLLEFVLVPFVVEFAVWFMGAEVEELDVVLLETLA
jgi:hypothetical protein